MTGREAIEKTLEILGFDPFDYDEPETDNRCYDDRPTVWDRLPKDVFMAVFDLVVERHKKRKNNTVERITSIWDLLPDE